MPSDPQQTLVQVSNPLERQQVEYVADYCGIRPLTTIEDSSQLRLQLPSGETITTRNAVLRELVKQSKFAAALLGEEPLSDALIWDWLAFCNKFSLASLADLQKIHDHLATRTYLASSHSPSLADLVLATLVHRPVRNFPSGQAAEYRNLVRWYDLIQHTTPLTAHFPEVAVTKPGIPAPPVVAPPAKEKAKASEAAATKAQAAAKAPAQPTPSLDSAAKPSDASSTTQAPQNGQAAGATQADKASKAGKPGKQPQQAAGEASPASAPATPGQPPEAAAEGKGKKAGKADKAKPAAAAKSDAEPEFDALDVRVGKILSVKKHPNAESLYVEDIDIGEDKPRQVVSGLVKFVPQEAMQDRMVLVVCNMKPAKMRDVMSYGMVLCASNAAHDQVDPLSPAQGTAVGDKVSVAGFEGEPEAQLNPKKKVFEKVAAHFKTSSDGQALFRDTPFQTAAGLVTSSIGGGSIS